ncbi:MAG: NUDIX pyrophosphatase [Candidatus Thorarchaeota archaeon]
MEEPSVGQGIPVECKGVVCLVIRKSKDTYQTLLLRRKGSYEGEWCYVSGRIEGGEKAWEAALRETREETGLVPDRLYSADTAEQFYLPKKDDYWIAPVFVAFVGPDQEVQLNFEHSEYIWTSFEDAIPKVPFPPQKIILEYVNKWFVQNEPSKWLLIDSSGI